MVIGAADYPFLDILWTMIIFFAWVVWIWMIVSIFSDVFRRRDIGGWAKAAWCVFMIVLPFVGVLVYLISQHDKMAERNLAQVEARQKMFDDHVRQVATADGAGGNGGGGAAREITEAKQLLDSGTIDQSEFDSIKAKALATA